MSIRKTIVTVLCAAAFLCLSGCDSQDYKTALGLMENQQWTEAREIFIALEDYKESADMLTECDYNIALSGCLYNLRSQSDPEAKRIVFDKLKNEAFASLEISGHDADYYYSDENYNDMCRVLSGSFEAYMASLE